MQFPSSEMRPQMVIFGDSITEQSFRSGGWGASLADNYSRKHGYSKNSAVRVPGTYRVRVRVPVRRYAYRVREKRVRYVWLIRGSATPPVATTIFFGANDAALFGRTSERQHVPTEEYKENLRKIVHHLKEIYLPWRGLDSPIVAHGHEGFSSFLTTMAASGLGNPSCSLGHALSSRAMELPERTNEMTGVYAKQCVELAKELGLPSINLWLKMQETEGWQKKFLSDGLHLTPEGNAVVHQEVVRVFNEAGLSAPEMPYDFPHHSEIDGKAPEKAFQQQCL
ncbi:hypothetical protein TEA_000666 [Camellia sinensis var. sinensis]|uniref:Uncharacterized protein n=1 Tax=Camellia sinensis var. sinensis TaxID=542762 RepID=A0A4S4EY86_CAMSN|nr:hypothetical protein TEA_000666 [Camellia sinensis var. sinensis]